jgi:hypothetical protein
MSPVPAGDNGPATMPVMLAKRAANTKSAAWELPDPAIIIFLIAQLFNRLIKKQSMLNCRTMTGRHRICSSSYLP